MRSRTVPRELSPERRQRSLRPGQSPASRTSAAPPRLLPSGFFRRRAVTAQTMTRRKKPVQKSGSNDRNRSPISRSCSSADTKGKEEKENRRSTESSFTFSRIMAYSITMVEKLHSTHSTNCPTDTEEERHLHRNSFSAIFLNPFLTGS